MLQNVLEYADKIRADGFAPNTVRTTVKTIEPVKEELRRCKRVSLNKDIRRINPYVNEETEFVGNHQWRKA